MTAVMARGHAKAEIGVLKPHEQVQAAPIRMAIELRSPVEGQFRAFIDANRVTDPSRMVTPALRVGHSVAICGAGPSLAKAEIVGVDAVWACNSAVPYLEAWGEAPDVAIGIDQTDGLLREWSDPPAIPYYLATTVDPRLVAHLTARDRSVFFLHNWVGIEGERAVYDTFPPGVVLGEGFTVVSRAIGLALWMGYERVDVYGADCAFADNDIAHANGDKADEAYRNPLILTGEINGRTWRTRPDMLMDAVHLVKRVRSSQGRVRLMGDTLPVALLGKDDAFLEQVCRSLKPGERPEDSDGQ